MMDELLKEYSRTGDKALFKKIADVIQFDIRRIVFTVLRQEEDIEDVMQEVLISLAEGIRRFRFESGFKTYLYRVTRNKCLDFLRKKRSMEKTVSWDDDIQIPSDPTHGPETMFLKRDRQDVFLKALFSMEEQERMLIFLKDVQDIPLAELGKIMKLSLGTVKSKLFRGRHKLAIKIKEAGYEKDR